MSNILPGTLAWTGYQPEGKSKGWWTDLCLCETTLLGVPPHSGLLYDLGTHHPEQIWWVTSHIWSVNGKVMKAVPLALTSIRWCFLSLPPIISFCLVWKKGNKQMFAHPFFFIISYLFFISLLSACLSLSQYTSKMYVHSWELQIIQRKHGLEICFNSLCFTSLSPCRNLEYVKQLVTV